MKANFQKMRAILKKMKANFLFCLIEKKFPVRESKEFHP